MSKYPASGRVVIEMHHGRVGLRIWQPHLGAQDPSAEVIDDLARQASTVLAQVISRYNYAQVNKDRVRRFSAFLREGSIDKAEGK